jgi:hypothetical protein
LQLRGKGIYRYQAAPAIALVEESIQKYGTASLNLDMPYQQNIGIAQSLATAVAEIYGMPETRPQRMTIAANHDDDLMQQALIREIGDHIGVAETVSGLAAGAGHFIHEVEMECHGLHDLQVTWGLIPAWPERLLVSYTGPVGTQVHDLDVAPLVVSDPGDYSIVYNKIGNNIVVRGAAGGGGGGGGDVTAGGGGGEGGEVNTTGVSVSIVTSTYTGKVGVAGSGGAIATNGTAGGLTEYRVPAGTIHLSLAGGNAGARGNATTAGAGGTGGGTGGNGGAGGGGAGANGTAGTANASGAGGGGGGGQASSFDGGAGGNGIDQSGGASVGGSTNGIAASGAGGSMGTGGNSGGGGSGGGGALLGGGYRAGGGGGGAGGSSGGGTGGSGGSGALSITKV